MYEFLDYPPGGSGNLLAMMLHDELPECAHISYHDSHHNSLESEFETLLITNPDLFDQELQKYKPKKSYIITHGYGQTHLLRKYFPKSKITKVIVGRRWDILYTNWKTRVPGATDDLAGLTKKEQIDAHCNEFYFMVKYHSQQLNDATHADSTVNLDNLYHSYNSFANEVQKLGIKASTDTAYTFFSKTKDFIENCLQDKQSVVQQGITKGIRRLEQDRIYIR